VNVRDCAPDFAMKAKYRNDFDSTETILIPLDTALKEKVCSCAPVFNFLRLPPTDDTTKYADCRSPKNGKIWGFTPLESDNKPIETKFDT